jgi:very-short-patch-repair endonuclease
MTTSRWYRRAINPRSNSPHNTRLRALAESQAGVVSRRQLFRMRVTRWELHAHLRAERWQRITDQAIALHTGPLPLEAELWAAVLHGGRKALLDGAASLVASGLLRYDLDVIRVSVPRGVRVRRTPRYDVRQTRRWAASDAAPSGIPRTRVAVAAVRAFLWASTDRQATHVLTLTVQQGLATPAQLGEEAIRVRRDKRRRLLHAVINDLLDGVRALGELDVRRELERRGLPLPQHQVVRCDRSGRYYLDLCWPDLGVLVEVDGIHHAWVENVVPDALRQNALALAGDVVLRLPLLGLRLQPEEFFAQIARALRDAAERRAAA